MLQIEAYLYNCSMFKIRDKRSTLFVHSISDEGGKGLYYLQQLLKAAAAAAWGTPQLNGKVRENKLQDPGFDPKPEQNLTKQPFCKLQFYTCKNVIFELVNS